MTTPDVVSVIAETLAWHYVGIDPRHEGLRCGCGQEVDNAEAHQARAVLAALAKAGVMERALFDIEGRHHFHGNQCLCGFESARSRSRTEHITGLVRAALPWTVAES